MLHICENAPRGGVTAVERFFKFKNGIDLEGATVMVDVVCNGGDDWIKVFARKRQALHKKWLGKCNKGILFYIKFLSSLSLF